MSENSLRAADAVNPEWLPEYKKQRTALFMQLRELNTRRFILEKVELFPFWLFTPNSRDYVFWHTIRLSLMDTVIMIASRVIVESGKDALTLKNYKAEILRNTIDQAAKKEVLDRLQSVNFDKRVQQLESKIRNIRNNYLAHLDRLQNTLEPKERTQVGITYDEMAELSNAAFELFYALSFETAYSPWVEEYGDHIRATHQTDIERLLDHVAQSSRLLHLPERDPEHWQKCRLKLNEVDIEQINYYRKQAGLPEVS